MFSSHMCVCTAAAERHSSGIPAPESATEASGEATRGALADGGVAANGNASADGYHVDSTDQEQVAQQAKLLYVLQRRDDKAETLLLRQVALSIGLNRLMRPFASRLPFFTA